MLSGTPLDGLLDAFFPLGLGFFCKLQYALYAPVYVPCPTCDFCIVISTVLVRMRTLSNTTYFQTPMPYYQCSLLSSRVHRFAFSLV
jgi:hypothetical protein